MRWHYLFILLLTPLSFMILGLWFGYLSYCTSSICFYVCFCFCNASPLVMLFLHLCRFSSLFFCTLDAFMCCSSIILILWGVFHFVLVVGTFEQYDFCASFIHLLFLHYDYSSLTTVGVCKYFLLLLLLLHCHRSSIVVSFVHDFFFDIIICFFFPSLFIFFECLFVFYVCKFSLLLFSFWRSSFLFFCCASVYVVLVNLNYHLTSPNIWKVFFFW